MRRLRPPPQLMPTEGGPAVGPAVIAVGFGQQDWWRAWAGTGRSGDSVGMERPVQLVPVCRGSDDQGYEVGLEELLIVLESKALHAVELPEHLPVLAVRVQVVHLQSDSGVLGIAPRDHL